MTKDFGDLHISWTVQSSAGIKGGSCAKSKAEWKVPLQYKSAKVLTYGILGNKSNATLNDITQTKYNIWWNTGIITSNRCGLCALQLLNATLKYTAHNVHLPLGALIYERKSVAIKYLHVAATCDLIRQRNNINYKCFNMNCSRNLWGLQRILHHEKFHVSYSSFGIMTVNWRRIKVTVFWVETLYNLVGCWWRSSTLHDITSQTMVDSTVTAVRSSYFTWRKISWICSSEWRHKNCTQNVTKKHIFRDKGIEDNIK
jgi:hypothetical protein